MYPKLYIMCNKETGTFLKIYARAEDGISVGNFLHFKTMLKILILDTI